jgi:hypothetical protein
MIAWRLTLRLIELCQQGSGDIDIHALNRLRHAALALKKPGHVSAPLSQSGNSLS